MKIMQFFLMVLFFMALPHIAHCQSIHLANSSKIGFTLGTLVAVALSWGKNKSVLWCIIHGFFSWAYVIYYLITK